MKRRIFRSVRSVTVLAISISLLLTIIIVIIVLNALMMKNINNMEREDVEKRMHQVEVAVNFELMDLKKTATDWAEWDDAYQFADDQNQQFVTENLAASFMVNLRLDSMIYVDQHGSFIYAQQLDKNSSELEPVPDAVKERVKGFIGSDANKRVQELITGPEGVLLIATNPILTSDGGGPSHGTLVIFRYLNGSETEYLSKMLNQDISLEDVSSKDPKKGLSGKHEDSAYISTQVLSDKIIRGTITLYDLDGNPVVKISSNMSRDMSAIGRGGIVSAVVSMVICSVLFISLILVFLHKHLISRLLSICRSIKTISMEQDLSRRLKQDSFGDELSTISNEINGMLAKLQKSRSDIESREKDLSIMTDDLKQEIAERKKAEEEIVYLAYHDHLTGLPNRLHFSEHLSHGIQLAKRAEKMLAILFLDLDGFKMINDSMGHLSGDTLLVEVSKRLKSSMRECDSVARMGGDEFVVMVENIDDVQAVQVITKRTVDVFREPFLINNQECFISTSIGVAVYPPDGEDDDTLVKNADIAMYRAKEKGKNQYVMCSEGIKNKVVEAMRISNQLFRALEHDEFEVYYQPQINCTNNRIVGAEALIRWHNPELGMVLPGRFIPIAEQTGLILNIGEWVLRTACIQAKKWQDDGYPGIRMGVNLSIRQFQNHNIVSEVQSVLESTGLAPTFLELEITESIAMHEKEYVLEALNAFRDMGIHISIDDFGTEYSSMSHLKQLPVDRIKIPMPFVQGINTSQKDEAITKSIIVLAKSLGLGVIAEGVETETQYEFLTQKMCDEIQGFYCFKPMPAADFEKLLAPTVY